MGDLSGKLGTLGLEQETAHPCKTYSFYDENLHLLGPLTSEIGALVVVSQDTMQLFVVCKFDLMHDVQ